MKPPIITLERLKKRTGWNHIALESDSYEVAGVRHTTQRFSLLASQKSWPTIDLYFDEHFRCLDPLGFSKWHAHYDKWTDPRRNLVDALRAVRELVVCQLGLIEQLDKAGKYWGGGVASPGAIPPTLGKNIKRLRRVYFDRAPEFEEIDFSRYWEGKHLFVEKNYKEATEQLLRENHIPITW
jgi:hypothetical protein